MAVRILLADDHRVTLEGLRSLLGKEEDFRVVGEAADGSEAVSMTRKLRPDVVILDVEMPGTNGVEAAREITSQAHVSRLVVLSMHNEKQFVVQMLRAGASAYVLKDCTYRELTAAIRAVLQGKTYLCSRISEDVLNDFLDGLRADNRGVSLTAREREVLGHVAAGRSTKDVAARLNVSHKTIETHRRNIMRKLELDTLGKLIRYAIKEGIVAS